MSSSNLRPRTRASANRWEHLEKTQFADLSVIDGSSEARYDGSSMGAGEILDACPLCHSSTIYPLDEVRRGLCTWRCRQCSVVFLNPRPTMDSVHAGALLASYLEGARSAGLLDQQDQPDVDALRNAYPEALSLAKDWCNGERIVDIGCGAGLLTTALRAAGHDVVGLEPAPAWASFARERLMLDVICADLFDYRLPQRYEFGIFNSCIEHMPDPIAALAAIRSRIIRPQGLLVVTAPNIESLEYLRDGSGWRIYHERHLWYFSERSLRFVATRAGYHVVDSFRPAFALPPEMQPTRKYIEEVLGLRRNLYGGIGLLLRAV